MRISRRAVLALSTLIVMVPAAIVFADSYRRDSQNRIIHHHTSAYSVYYGFTGGWKDRGEDARVEWNADLDRLAQGAHISLPRVDTPSDSVGATNDPEIEVQKDNLGDTGTYITFSSPWHDANSPVTINTYYSVSDPDKRGRMCRVFGNILGLANAGSNSGRDDCMQNPTTWQNVSDDSAQLVDDFYGPSVTIDSPLVARQDDVKTTGVYDVSATADGHATKSVTVRLDGNVIASKTQTPCDGKCSLTPDSLATVQGLSAGTHTLSATARNEFDQTTTKTITLTVAAPAPDWGFAEDWDRVSNPDILSQIPRTGQGAATNMGATTNRLIVRWNSVEPDPPVNGVHTYHWGNAPAAYDAMLDAGQKPVLTLYAAPDWARIDGWQTCPSSIYDKGCAYPPDPSQDDNWQEFVRQAVIKFPQVLAIEIWNEPNLQTFWYDPLPSASRYDQVLAAGCQGAKQGAQDAGIGLPPVIVAGLAPGPAQAGPDPPTLRQQGTYLTNIYAAEAGNPTCADTGASPDFKGIGEHVYGTGSTNAQWVASQTDTIDQLRDARAAAGDGPARIWITEDGVTTAKDLSDANHREPNDQGPLLKALYNNAGSDVKLFLIFRYRDLEQSDVKTTDKWSHMGVVQSDDNFTAKPAFSFLRCELGGRKCAN